MKAINQSLSIFVLSGFLFGCGGGLQSSGSASSPAAQANGPSSQAAGGGATTGGAQPSWQNVANQVNSYATGPSYNGDLMIAINTTNQTLELILPIPLPQLGFTPIIPTSVAGLNGVSIEPTTLPDGSEAWMVSVPLNLLLKGTGASANPSFNALPNGSPLPFFPSQEVSGLSVSLPSRPGYSINVYVAIKAVAVFVGIPGLKLPIGFNWTVQNASKTRQIGDLALIPSVGSFPAGVYLAAQVPDDLALALNQLLITN